MIQFFLWYLIALSAIPPSNQYIFRVPFRVEFIFTKNDIEPIHMLSNGNMQMHITEFKMG